jgi:hypothetical protein
MIEFFLLILNLLVVHHILDYSDLLLFGTNSTVLFDSKKENDDADRVLNFLSTMTFSF